MHSNLDSIVSHVVRERNSARASQVTTIEGWYKMDYLRYKMKFVLEAILKVDTDPNLADHGGFGSMLDDMTTLLSMANRDLVEEEPACEDPRYIQLAKPLVAALKAPADYDWTERDLLYGVRLTFVQCMLLGSDDTAFFQTINNRLFSMMYRLLFPSDHRRGSIFNEPDYQLRARSLLMSYLLWCDSLGYVHLYQTSL